MENLLNILSIQDEIDRAYIEKLWSTEPFNMFDEQIRGEEILNAIFQEQLLNNFRGFRQEMIDAHHNEVDVINALTHNNFNLDATREELIDPQGGELLFAQQEQPTKSMRLEQSKIEEPTASTKLISNEHETDSASHDYEGDQVKLQTFSKLAMCCSNDMFRKQQFTKINKIIRTIQDDEKYQELDDLLKEKLYILLSMISDADPMYLSNQLVIWPNEPNQLAAIIDYLLDNGYPRINWETTQKQQCHRQSLLLKKNFDVKMYLLQEPDPHSKFIDHSTNMTGLYKQHVNIYLLFRYCYLSKKLLDGFMAHFNHHLYPIVKYLDEHGQRDDCNSNRSTSEFGCTNMVNCKNTFFETPFYWSDKTRQYLLKPRRVQLQWPAQFDENFFIELQFCEMKDEILAEKKQLDQKRASLFEKFEKASMLITCGVCFDECLPTEMVTCKEQESELAEVVETANLIVDGLIDCSDDWRQKLVQMNDHTLLCTACLRQHALSQCEQGADHIACAANNCKSEYEIERVKAVLTKNIGAMLDRRHFQRVMRDASITLLHCPFCDFAVQVDEKAEDVRVIHCLNEECLKTSCTKCNRLSHLPLTCDESVVDDERTRIRVFIENKMAEALIRYCPKCKAPIVRADGCDKMHCTRCGCNFCYRCKVSHDNANQVYAHIQTTHNNINNGEIHMQAIAKAAEEAKLQYFKNNSEAKYDSGKLMVDKIVKDLQINLKKFTKELSMY